MDFKWYAFTLLFKESYVHSGLKLSRRALGIYVSKSHASPVLVEFAGGVKTHGPSKKAHDSSKLLKSAVNVVHGFKRHMKAGSTAKAFCVLFHSKMDEGFSENLGIDRK